VCAVSAVVLTDTRWYAPNLGRFATRDSLFGRVADPASLNQLGYVMGNPVGHKDPLGMHGDCEASSELDPYGSYIDGWMTDDLKYFKTQTKFLCHQHENHETMWVSAQTHWCDKNGVSCEPGTGVFGNPKDITCRRGGMCQKTVTLSCDSTKWYLGYGAWAAWNKKGVLSHSSPTYPNVVSEFYPEGTEGWWSC
jgi:RHS repeat-associated protein